MWGSISKFMFSLLLSKFMFSLLLTNTLYFDGSHTNQFTKSGAGCVIMDSNGDLVIAAAYNLGDIDPQNVTIVEAIALLNGLKLAQKSNIKVDRIKGDSKEVIDHVRGQASNLSEITAEIKGILNVLNIDPLFKVELISREGNGVADSLGSEGSRLWSASKVYNGEDELPTKTAQLVRQKKFLNGGGESNGNGGLRNFNKGPSTNYGGSCNTGLVETVGTAGAAIAGIAMIGYGVSKILKRVQPKNKDKGKFRVLHVDGLDSHQLEKAAAGCIIRDEDGELVVASAYNLDYCYPNCHIAVAEAMALKKGLELARENEIELDLIKVDNEEVFNRVLGYARPPKEPKLVHVIEEIRSYLDELSIDRETQLELVSSDDNQVADVLANVGRGLIKGKKKYYDKRSRDIPDKVANLIAKEKKDFVGS